MKRFHRTTFSLLICCLGLFAASCGSSGGSSETATSRLDVVKERDRLICGSRDDLTGFAQQNPDGQLEGFDIEFCRVIAAGILGDASKVEIRPLGAERFTATQAGEVDILFRNATHTAVRDGSLGLSFPFTTVYDGQRMMVSADSGIMSLDDLQDETICVVGGTTTEKNLTSVFNSRGISFTPKGYNAHTELRNDYLAGQCAGYTADGTVLFIYKFISEKDGGPEQRILPEVMSNEPLGAVIADGDTRWEQAVTWVMRATVLGWAYGLDSTNINNYDGGDPNIERFLGRTEFDAGLGIDPDFAVNVISQVGNYKEIYDRTLGAVGLVMEGSPNRLWTDGGLLYSPPYV